MKKLSILLIIAGLGFLGFGGYQWFATNQAQNTALAEAKELLEPKESNEDQPKEIEKSKEKKEDFIPSNGETVGILHIPKLESDLPIVEGTDEDELARGVGHYKGTAYPTEGEQIVLSGHRDTVFRRMGELELGDIFVVQLPYGDFSYEIVDTKIVDADDRTIIKPQGEEVLTVTTCYPFDFVGYAPDRYILTAKPVSK
mgnify:FL=1